jgi:hypothetical protein
VKISSTPVVITTALPTNSPPVPVDSRSNPVNVWGSVIDGGTSTYAIQYTTSDVFAAGYNPATDPMWTGVPSGPTTGSKPFNITALGMTAIRLQVTATTTSVTLGPVFQSDSTVGA